MLSDEYLQGKYAAHIDKLCELAEKEVQRTRQQPKVQEVAGLYLKQFLRARQLFEECRHRLLDCFIELMGTGSLEIMASAATHGYLPLICQSQGCRSSNRLGY